VYVTKSFVQAWQKAERFWLCYSSRGDTAPNEGSGLLLILIG
jgi:hypothetical protein